MLDSPKLWSRLALAIFGLFATGQASARGAAQHAPRLSGPSAVGVPAALPQIELGGTLGSMPAMLPVSAFPGASAGVGVAAQAHLTALDPSAAPASADAAQNAAAAQRVYDGAKAFAEPQASAVPGSYTSTPAELPLAPLSPAWRAAQPAAAGVKPLANRKPGKNRPVDLGDERELSSTDGLRRVSGTAPTSISPRDAVSYFEAPAFEAAGAKQIGLVGQSVIWIDHEGKLNAYEPATKRSSKLTGPMGEIERFAVAEDGTLFVAAGGTVQRWDLASGSAVVLLDERFSTSGGVELSAGASGLEFVVASGRYAWTHGRLYAMSGPSDQAAPEPLTQTSAQAAWKQSGSSTELWLSGLGAWSLAGSIPAPAAAVALSKDGALAYAVSENALVQWEVAAGRYRSIEVPGLADAAVLPRRVETSADGRHVLLVAGDRFFYVDTQKQSAEVNSPEGQVRLWSERNPMFVRDGKLHIGEFTFPVATRYEKDRRSSTRKLVDRILGRKFTPAALPPMISEKNWRALNLPSNKYNLYQTLRSFSLGQHVMYVGETGGGKTWLADMIAQITNNELWMVSLTEYTRNQDLIARDTFGEEGENKTGLSMSVVLKWLENGGLLLLDEMHKPLEGIAAMNNILQNLEYRMPDGRVIKGDPKKSFVIGTMNPVKPPYKGEPPSGELESRFGTKLRVNYLPPAEEAALLQIAKPELAGKMAQTLIAIANELRKSYPDVLPLPISSRTLLHIVQEIAAFPNDDPTEIFKVKYNPMALLDDPSIGHAIDLALKAHNLSGVLSHEGGKKKPQ